MAERDGKIDQLIKFMLLQHNDPSSIPEPKILKPGMEAHAYTLSAGEVESGGSLELTGPMK